MTEPSHDVLVETLKVAVPLHIAELRGYPPAHPMGALEAWLQDRQGGAPPASRRMKTETLPA